MDSIDIKEKFKVAFAGDDAVDEEDIELIDANLLIMVCRAFMNKKLNTFEKLIPVAMTVVKNLIQQFVYELEDIRKLWIGNKLESCFCGQDLAQLRFVELLTEATGPVHITNPTPISQFDLEADEVIREDFDEAEINQQGNIQGDYVTNSHFHKGSSTNDGFSETCHLYRIKIFI